ncbi:MAG: hypothetical protein ACI3XQ_09425, partial [Eubacteriales bacterium]
NDSSDPEDIADTASSAEAGEQEEAKQNTNAVMYAETEAETETETETEAATEAETEAETDTEAEDDAIPDDDVPWYERNSYNVNEIPSKDNADCEPEPEPLPDDAAVYENVAEEKTVEDASANEDYEHTENTYDGDGGTDKLVLYGEDGEVIPLVPSEHPDDDSHTLDVDGESQSFFGEDTEDHSQPLFFNDAFVAEDTPEATETDVVAENMSSAPETDTVAEDGLPGDQYESDLPSYNEEKSGDNVGDLNADPLPFISDATASDEINTDFDTDDDESDVFGVGMPEWHDTSDEGIEIEEGATESAKSSTNSRFTRMVVRLAGTCVLLLASLLLELMPLLSVHLSGLLDYVNYPVTYILIDMQLLVLAAALSAKKIADGFRRLLTAGAGINSVIAMTSALTVLYGAVSCIFSSDGLPLLFNSVPIFYILISLAAQLCREKRTARNSAGLSGNMKIYTMVQSDGAGSLAEKMYRGGFGVDKNVYEPVLTENVMTDIPDVDEDEENNVLPLIKYWIIPAFVFSVLTAVLAMILGAELAEASCSLMISFLALVPLCAKTSRLLPFFISSHRLAKRGCYIRSVEDARRAANCDAIVFSDRHLFGGCRPEDNGIKIYDEGKTREVMESLRALYSVIKGPMAGVFDGVPDESGASGVDVKLVRVARAGVEAVIDRKKSVILGKKDFIRRYGILLGDDDDRINILYLVIDSKPAAKIILNYKPEPLFDKLCEMLADNGISVAIETYDPVISGHFVAATRESGAPPVNVIHKNLRDFYRPPRKPSAVKDTGIYACSSRLKLVEIAVFCKKIVRADKAGAVVRASFTAVTAALAVALSVLGAAESVNSFFIILYQLLWLGISDIAARCNIPQEFEAELAKAEKRKDKRKEKEKRQCGKERSAVPENDGATDRRKEK